MHSLFPSSFTPHHPVLAYYENPTKSNFSSLLPPLSDEVIAKLLRVYPAAQDRAQLERLLVHKMPKTDLHVHGEAGFLMDIALARRIAARNHMEFPEDLVDKTTNLWKYRGKENFEQFIKDFLRISALIKTPEDIEEIAYSFYKYCYEHNVIFALPGISWLQCMSMMSFTEFNEAYNRAIARGIQEFGDVTLWRLRYYQERHASREEFAKTWEALNLAPNPLITTIGLAGAEKGHLLSDFVAFYREVQTFRKATNNPWYFLTAHMEAESDAHTIAASLALQIKNSDQNIPLLDWVAHGRRAADESAVVEQLKQQHITLELCPLSDVNVYPQTIPTLKDHVQLRKLLEAGVISLNSDDPAFFTGIDEVFMQVWQQLPASFAQLLQCTLNGISPASPYALQEMQKYQPESYADYQEMVKLGLLKIQFYQYYWQLLPLLINVEDGLAKELFTIDIKTDAQVLEKLKQKIVDAPIKQQINKLSQIREEIDVLTAIVVDKTKALIDDYADSNSLTLSAFTS